MKASRLLSILLHLQTCGRTTAGALASALEVSERTILRDIDQLSAAGVPLWGERGRHGGFQLRPGWTTQLTGMTEAEAHALLLAGMPGPATDLGLGEAAVSARMKLLASVPAALQRSAATVAERLHIDPLDWYREADTPAYLRQAAEAVWLARCVRVKYTSWRGTSRHDLEPLGLVLKAGAWYMVARRTGRAEPRTYRLASFVSMELAGTGFRRPRQFDLARYWRDASARFEAELRSLQALVLVSPRAMGWLVHARSRFQPVHPLPSGVVVPIGWHAVSFPVESIDQGARQVLGYGAEVEVVAPLALREEVVKMAAAALERYAPRTTAPAAVSSAASRLRGEQGPGLPKPTRRRRGRTSAAPP